MDASSLFWGVLFGTIGLAYFTYGRKQQRMVPLVCGLVLMVFPYFLSNILLLIVIGVALSALPYFLRD